MAISPVGIVLGVVSVLVPSSPIQVDAFVLPTPLSERLSVGLTTSPKILWTKSSLAYDPRDGSDEERDTAPTPASPFSANYFQKQETDDEYDPACSAEDEDCLAFSSLEDQPLVFNANTNEDPLCDPQDVDCQAFLPKTYLTSDTYLAAELKTRSNSIEKERTDHNWKTAHCPTSFVSISNSDWVRRVHMETYPMAVCGGARGGVYVVNLEEKSIIGKAEGAHIVQVEQGGSNKMAKQAMDKLYGKLDGGGVVAVAIHGDLVASSGREGGVRLWRIEKSENNMGSVTGGELISLGSVPGVQNTVVTSLKFDSNDLLWTACYDGTVRAYDISGYDDSSVRKPLFQSDFTDSVLDMHLCEELKLGVCATADGGAALFNMDDGQFFVGIMLFEVAARSVIIIKHKNDDAGYSVLCGGTDGVIHRIPLNVNPTTGRVDEDDPFGVSETTDTAIKPRHVGPVMCMTSPDDGVFISGGQDGTLRVWNCAEGENDNVGNDGVVGNQQAAQHLQTKCMYALTGYKLWLGSACTDGKRLLSDGGENAVIVRDFSLEPGTNGKPSL
mmetsp:Transcript_20551/g.44606  ORF Transcript_20551/g.44606 Transcript_20551/m.44606 type:complete len:556 (-) Transcript_20551:99-1766(-)